MKKTSKIVSIVLAIAMIMGLGVVMASAADTAVFKITKVSETDTQLTVKVDLKSAGTGIGAIDFTFNYDTDKLTFSSVTEGRTGSIAANNSSAGVVKFSAASPAGFIADDSLGTIVLTKKTKAAVTQKDISAIVETLSDVNGVAMTGSVDMSAFPAAPATTTTTTKKNTTTTTTKKATTTTKKATTTTTESKETNVKNPNTGTNVAIAAAVASLFAVSAAGVVVLRKKED